MRFSTILADLCKEVPTEPQSLAIGADPPASPMDDTSKPRTALPGELGPPKAEIAIGEIIDRTSRAGFGFVVALLALIAIPFTGLSTPFGLTIAFVGGQMMTGRARPWLPQRVRRRRISMASLARLGQRVARWTAGLERVVRPRFPILAEGPFWIICGIAIVLQGIGLALPLPIPGSNWVFIIPIIIYGIGLLESDGLLIVLGHAITLVEVVLACWLWEVIVHALVNSWDWFLKLFS